jgi:signal transduction histidine kinase
LNLSRLIRVCPLPRVLLLTGLLLFSIQRTKASTVQADTFKIKGANSEPLYRHLVWFNDISSRLSIQAILDTLHTGHFSVCTEKTFNRGFSKGVFYFAITLKNDTSIVLPLLWNFYSHSLWLYLYDISDPEKPVSLDSCSMHQTRAKRKYPLRSASFPFEIKPGSSRTLLVKARTSIADNLYVPMDISTREDILLYEIDYTLLLSLYFGYFIFACLLNLLLGLVLKTEVYAWHAAYIFVLICFCMYEFHFDSLLLPDWLYPYWVKIPKIFYVALALVFGLKVFELFIGQKEQYPRWHKTLQITRLLLFFTGLAVLICAFSLPDKNSLYVIVRMTLSSLNVIAMLLLFANLVYGVFRKNQNAVYYGFSILILFIGTISFMLNVVHLGRFIFLSPGNTVVGLTFEITLLTILFVFNYRKEKGEAFSNLQFALKTEQNQNKEVQQAEQNERERIAQDLHDDLGGTLSALHLQFGRPENTINQQTTLLLTKALDDLRTISHRLMPLDFWESGLNKSLKHYISHLRPLQVEYRFSGDEKCISAETQLSLYRIILELLNNIRKHAAASTCTLQCIIFDNFLRITVEDNGQGFDPSHTRNGIGLQNCASRIKRMQGTLQIDSQAGGTCIVIEIPITPLLNEN